MKFCNDFTRKLNDSEVLIVFKLLELSRSCSKWITNIFQLSQSKPPMEKRVQENSVYKEPSVLKEN